MIKNYFTSAYRNLFRKKLYSFINLVGLTLGTTCCLFIFLYVQNEYNYDKFHVDGQQVFRVLRKSNDDKGAYKVGVTSGPFAPTLMNDFENVVINATRVLISDGLVTYDDISFMEEKIALADSTFFDIFSFPLVAGAPETVLDGSANVVITQSMAKKYFGDEDPLGKVLTLDQEFELKVTGIFDELPGNSHLDFDFLASISIIKDRTWFSDWWSNTFYTYIKLRDYEDRYFLEERFEGFMEKYFGDDFRRTGTKMDLLLEPLSEVYFNHETRFDGVVHGNKSRTIIFTFIALFILVIACINFLNLSTATASSRALEVGIRKASGAGRKDLILQFLIESLIFSTIATILAFFLSEVGLSFFNGFVEKEIIIPFSKVIYLSLAFATVLLISILSGLYPALVLSSFRPALIIRKNLLSSDKGRTLRKFLVVFQFSISLILILATIVVNAQLNYVSNKELGFNRENVVLLPFTSRDLYNNREQVKRQLNLLAQVQSVTFISGEPGGFHDNYSFTLPEEGRKKINMRTLFTDHDFQKVFEIPLATGRVFSRDFQTDPGEALIINEEAVKYLGWNEKEVFGKLIQNNFTDTIPKKVIGVIKNYHFSSLKNKIDPLVIAIGPYHRKMAVKIDRQNTAVTLKKIEEIWQRFANGFPFVYNFMDKEYDDLYRAEKKQRELFTVFTVIAILISCLGLFGLATFSAERRIKEIGIRKVLGAGMITIFILLSKDLLKLVVLACALSLPLGWWFMERWLNNFVYRIDIQFWMMTSSVLIAMVIAFITVFYHGMKAGNTNPVNALRTE